MSRAVASRVVATGVIDHKQLFLRMLLQLVNDKGTHGAVLVAILDALCDWVDDAALGPYDPLRSYTVSAATTQVTETASKISTTTADAAAAAAATTPAVPTNISGSRPKKRRIGSLSDKETVLFLSKMAQLTRMGLEATQTKDWENKLFRRYL